MPQSTPVHAVAAMTAAASLIQRQYDSASPLVPGPSPAATEMLAAGAAIRELLEAVKHEGSIRAIDAGFKVTDWRNHLTPVLRAAYDGAGGC